MTNWLKNAFITIRPHQWYKNLVVFLPIVFSGNILDINKIILSITAFISLCLISSLNYIVNDLLDKKKDSIDPVKKYRPIAANKLTTNTAITLALASGITGFGISIMLPQTFFICAITLFIISQAYNFWLKNTAIIDILAISTNFVIRAVAGAFAISVWVSPWLIIGIFFLAMFLVLNKRYDELIILKTNAKKHRKTLKFYSPTLIKKLRKIAITTVLSVYTIYSFFGPHKYFFITIPFVFFAINRYNKFCEKPNFAKQPEKIFLDTKFIISIILWAGFAITAIYFLPK